MKQNKSYKNKLVPVIFYWITLWNGSSTHKNWTIDVSPQVFQLDTGCSVPECIIPTSSHWLHQHFVIIVKSTSQWVADWQLIFIHFKKCAGHFLTLLKAPLSSCHWCSTCIKRIGWKGQVRPDVNAKKQLKIRSKKSYHHRRIVQVQNNKNIASTTRILLDNWHLRLVHRCSSRKRVNVFCVSSNFMTFLFTIGQIPSKSVTGVG